MGCWDYTERPKPTLEQIEKFLERAKSLGLMPDVESSRDVKKSSVLVDYLSLIE